MSCPGGLNIQHPLWAEWECEWRATLKEGFWGKIRREALVEPNVSKWIPCPGKNCGHKEDPLVALAP